MILRVNRLSYRYPGGKTALRDVSFSVDEGEYLAVLGANGSGKSTLLRCIAGLAPPGGETDPQAIQISRTPEEGRSVLAVVFQTPDDQLVAETAELDTAFGLENLAVPRSEMRERVSGALERFLPGVPPQTAAEKLTAGQKQHLALAGALAMQPDILLLDEPTSMLSEHARASLLEFLRQFQAEKKTVLHITHDMDEAVQAGRILVLHDGETMFDGTPGQFAGIPPDTLESWGLAYRGKPEEKEKPRTAQATLLECGGAGAGPFCGVSLCAAAGEIIAVTGESGSGKSLFLRMAAGITAPEQGEIKPAAGTVRALAVQESEDGLFEEFTADDVSFGPENAGLSGPALKQRVQEAMDRTGLPFARFADRKTFSLSGGEKRKAAIAGIVAMQPDILLLDEPFAALDVRSRGEMAALFRNLAAQGTCVIFSANRRADAEELADKILCLDDFRRTQEKPEAESGIQPPGRVQTGMTESSGAAARPFFSGGMPPAVKFLFCVVSVAASLLISRWPFLAAQEILLVFTAVQAGYRIRRLLSAVWKILPWLALILVIQCLLFQGFTEAAVFFLRFLCLLTALSVFVFITPPAEISYGAEDILFPLRIFGVPVRHVSFLTGLVFRFFPFLYSEADKLIMARKIRTGGYDAPAAGKTAKKKDGKIRQTAALIVPLALRTLAKAEKLSLAIAARGYSGKKHTRYLAWQLKIRHVLFLAVLLAFSAILIYGSRVWK